MLVVLFTIIIFMNARLVYRSFADQTEKVGETQLISIKSDLESYISSSKNILIKTASGAEQIIKSGESRAKLEDYIVQQKKAQIAASGGTTFNVYIAGKGWEIIPDFDMPSDYHATERSWYIGAVESKGDIFITDPYIDRMTGEMCYTLSVLLSDDDTVVAMDFTLSEIQRVVAKMSLQESGKSNALIITKEGMIVGDTDMAYVGKDLYKSLPEYGQLFDNLRDNPEKVSFVQNIGGHLCTVFHSETQNGWYMIISVINDELYGRTERQMILNIVINLLMLVIIVVLYIRNAINRSKTEEALQSRETFVEKLSEKLKEPLRDVIRLSDSEHAGDSEVIRGEFARIRTAGIQMDEMMNDLSSYSSIVSNMNKEKKVKKMHMKDISKSIRRARNVIVILLGLITVISTYSYYTRNAEIADVSLKSELSYYNHEFNEWELEQKTILDVCVNMIAAQPEILDDYDGAVKWLDSIASKYSNISVCYIANPFNTKHTVIMNNGWQPDENWKVEDRDWYKETAAKGYSISRPYIDEQTGNYCITISEKVFDKNENFLGIFGIDLYMDKIIDIFGNGYYSDEYVFLVDSNGDIINHPNPDYQMSSEKTVNIKDTPYKDAFNSKEIRSTRFKDYNGKYSECISVVDESTGFSIVVVFDWLSLNGLTIIYVVVFVLLIFIFIIVIITLVNKVIKSQANMNRQLSEAVEKATVAGKAKSDFLAQMSHEIRTPINAVIGMDEMILRESHDEEVREYATNIRNASKTLLSLINGVLDFSKIESGKMEIISGKYETVGMINNLVNMISDKAEKKGLSFNVDIDPALPRTLYGDDGRIRQIITNILTNAVKYTNTGSVTMTVKAEDVTPNDCTLYVEVKDTGIGIKEEDLDKLFISFQRLDERKNKNIEGTGLGMSIVEGLLSMMNSRLYVESEYGKGSKFYFRLAQKIVDGAPIGEYSKTMSKEAAEIVDTGVMRCKGADILVVDDNEMNLKVAKGLMKRLDIVPDLAESGMKCIDMIRKKHYDVVLMDHMMPVMDGIETLRKIREEQLLGDDTVVIALTANAIVGARETYLAEGFKDYLSKPIDPEKLDKMLAKYLPKEKVFYGSAEKDESEKAVGTAAGTDVKGAANSAANGSASGAEKDTAAGVFEDTAGKNESNKVENINFSSKDNNNVTRMSFIDKLRNEGFNTDAALNYAVDDEEFYRELLTTFVKTYDEKLKALNGFYNDKNWKEYQILVHALKSSSKTVGADRLSLMAFAQEQASKYNDEAVIYAGFNEMMSEYEKMIGIIKDALGMKDEAEDEDDDMMIMEFSPDDFK